MSNSSGCSKSREQVGSAFNLLRIVGVKKDEKG